MFARFKEELIEDGIDHGKKKEWMERVKGWKEALEEVPNLTGMALKYQADR